jgi:hypothetical protein
VPRVETDLADPPHVPHASQSVIYFSFYRGRSGVSWGVDGGLRATKSVVSKGRVRKSFLELGVS